MKKIFITLSVAFIALASCTKFVEDQPYVADSATAPKIATSEVKDSSFTFTITANKDNGYFSYAVIKGAAQELDPSDVLSVALKSKSVTTAVYDEDGVKSELPVCGTFDAAKTKYSPSELPKFGTIDPANLTYTFNLKGLVPNTKYTVYAVANSKKGTVTQLVTATILTTDNLTPHPLADKYGEIKVDDSELEDGILALAFNEPIVLTDNAKAKVHYHAINLYRKNPATELYEFQELLDEAVELPKDSLEVDGKNLICHIKPIPGAIAMITYPAGIVKNGVGTECPALENHVAYYDRGLYYEGAGARFETSTFNFYNPYVIDETTGKEVRMPADTVIYFSDTDPEKFMMALMADSLITPNHNALVPGTDTWEENGVDFKLQTYEPNAQKAVTYQMPSDSYMAILSVLAFTFGEEPAIGTYISYSIGAGSFEDLWGNTNTAFNNFDLSDEDNPIYGNYFYSNGYTLADIIGEYDGTGNNAFNGNPYDLPFKIEASDDAEEGNIMFTNVFGFEGKAYADFNVHSGAVVLPAQDFADGLVLYHYGAESISLTLVEPHKLAQDGGDFGMAVVEGGQLTSYAKVGGASAFFYGVTMEEKE